jgi:hypothetical protein
MNPQTPLEREVLEMLLNELGGMNQIAVRNLLVRVVALVERERVVGPVKRGPGRPRKPEVLLDG